jgi:hypothetical protein
MALTGIATMNKFVTTSAVFVGLALSCVAIVSTAQASQECAPVIDKTFPSPSQTKKVHLMNQYCAPGFGNGDNPYWVVIGDDVAKAGQEDRVVLGQEDHVVFKAWDVEPIVSWQDDEHLVIQIVAVSRIVKTLHMLGDVHISYRISEALSEDNFLRDQSDYEKKALADFKNHKSTFVGDPKQDVEVLKKVISNNLKDFRTFQAWAKENAQ